MDKIVNLDLMRHPLNWLIVWTVLLFAGFAWAVIHEGATGANIPTST